MAAPYLSHLSRQSAHGATTFHTLDLERGGEDPRHPERSRPPLVAHLVISAGDVEKGDPFAHPLHGRAVPLRAGLMRTKRERALFFGRVRWGEHDGALFLAPPVLFGGQLGNHLVFEWRQGKTSYLISLHSWEPLPDTAATLRAIVASAA